MAFKHHTNFAIPAQAVPRGVVEEYFSRLGYELIEQTPGEWRFCRGSKLAAFWRMNIRAYSTQLVVRSKTQPEGGSWVSCDFEVWTFMTLLFSGDVATLEAEARGLESALRQHAEPGAAPDPATSAVS